MERVPLRQTDVTIAGIRSPLIEGGPATAEEAVVFVHGNPGSSRDWEELAAQVSTFGRAVALDMPGFGRAQKPEHFDYTVDGYARHLGSALTELRIRRVHLVLHDFGGPWGLAWAAAHPDAFASVVLINTGAWLDYHWHVYARMWRTPVLGEVSQAITSRLSFHLLSKRDSPRGLPAAYVNQMYDTYDRGTRRAVLKLYRATANPARLSQGWANALRPLARPALVVWGKHDRYLPVQLAYRQREVFPNEGYGGVGSRWSLRPHDWRLASTVSLVRLSLSGNGSQSECLSFANAFSVSHNGWRLLLQSQGKPASRTVSLVCHTRAWPHQSEHHAG